MNPVTKQKWLAILILLLLLSNIATLIFLWFPGHKRDNLPPGGSGVFEQVVTELHFTESQKNSYANLRDQHHAAVEPLRKELREAKDAFFGLLKTDSVTEPTIQARATSITSIQEKIDRVTFDHFKQVRAICNPDQAKQFDQIIEDVIRRIASQGSGPGGPPPGDRNGPPPPDNRNHAPNERMGPPPPDGPPPGERMGPPPTDKKDTLKK